MVLEVTVPAGSGFQVRLVSGDMAACGAVFSRDPTIDEGRVREGWRTGLYDSDNQVMSETTWRIGLGTVAAIFPDRV